MWGVVRDRLGGGLKRESAEVIGAAHYPIRQDPEKVATPDFEIDGLG